jgi:hypothetical protein
MSGELKAMVEWAPADPVAAQKTRTRRWRRRERTPPTTRGAKLLYGLRRLVVVLAVVLGAVALVAWLIAWLRGSELRHVLPLAYYFAGAGLGAAAFLGGMGTYQPEYWRERTDRERAFSSSVELGLLALVVFGCGVLLEILL